MPSINTMSIVAQVALSDALLATRARIEGAEDRKKDIERLSAVFGAPEENVKDISLCFDDRLAMVSKE